MDIKKQIKIKLYQMKNKPEPLPELIIQEQDRNKVWAFCAGQASDDFRGNPKYLFIYINKYRKDITTYWLCQSEKTMKLVRSLGYKAYVENSVDGQKAISRTGVLVAEQVKNMVPAGLRHAKYLNLYHGIGGKQVERYLTEGILAEILAKKYITFNSFYRDRQLFLATSPITQDNFERMCGIDSDKIVQGGYPRCLYQKYFERIETFPHDIMAEKGLPSDTKMAVYAPTFRKDSKDNVFRTAFPDLDRLIDTCKKYHYMMVFKMHPIMENDPQYLLAKETYKDCPYLYFWDNKNDFYEIIDKVDLGIVDYSSIFTDMLDAGVNHYLRYVYDFEEYKENLTDPYDEITAGKRCMSFDELLEAMADYASTEVEAEVLAPIIDRFWKYSGKDTFENLINRTLEFEPVDRQRKNLYSFDIFDTLISRKVLDPAGIFFYVKEKMRRSQENFPMHLMDHYADLRRNCESNVREYYAKTMGTRHDMRKEIQFDEIFVRMQDLYGLTDTQIDLLKKWELEAELDNVIPIPENIEKCLSLVNAGEEVVLISDMYLPFDFIRRMLAKANPALAEIPLYLSSQLGWQKTTAALFMEVYRHYGAQYDFDRWIHMGDDELADRKMPRTLNIVTQNIVKPQFNDYESKLVEEIGTYDAYLLAGDMARFRISHDVKRQQFAYEYISLYMVPYVDWAIHEAVKRGDQVAYFISRDGHHLKRIADVIIEKEGLPIKTKYIYASRRTWRVPSFIHDIDEEFWGSFGNFVGANTYSKILSALGMNEEEFEKMFPELRSIDKKGQYSKDYIMQLSGMFEKSKEYREFVLEDAREKRVSVCGYLEQQIDASEQFSVIEYWGRGYTQDCFVNLWNHITGKEEDIPFYYARTILPTQKHSVRYNFTSNHTPQIFVEAIFANIDYKSIESYHLGENGQYEPDIVKIPCDQELLKAMEEYLPVFTEDYVSADFIDRESLRRSLFDFSLSYYHKNPENPIFLDIVAPLIDSVSIYGEKREFAKSFTMEDLDDFSRGEKRVDYTRNIRMSVARSNNIVKKKYLEMYQLQPGEFTNGGFVLTDKEIKENREYLKTFNEEQRTAYKLAELYDRYADRTEVEKKVVICGTGVLEKNTLFRTLFTMFGNDKDIIFDSVSFTAEDFNMEEAAKSLSTAAFIVVGQSVGELGKIKLREETKMIQLGEVAFNYFSQHNYRLKERQKLTELRRGMDVSILQVPSDVLADKMRVHYGLRSLVDCSLHGCSQTDHYFDPKAVEAARNKLYAHLEIQVPDIRKKKIIFYMPYFRYRSEKSKYMEFIDMVKLQKELGDEYFVIMHLMPQSRNNKSNVMFIPGFSADMTGKLYLREQIMVADIIIGDYRDSIFEATLMDKPIFVTCNDKFDMTKKETYFEYEDIIPGVQVNTDDELIEQIRHIDQYDYSISRAFREKYLKYCDGNSSRRVYEFIKKSLQNME